MEWLEEKKVEVVLGLTLIFGFIFRLINVYTKVLLGDPPHLALHSVNFLDSGLLIVWDQSAYLWYALTDIFYRIFGITQFASRFSSLLFGTLSIISIYLFTLEFSRDKRVALISSILFAFVPAFIWHAADEHDISVLFFIIMTFYTLIYGLKNNSKNYLIVSAIFFGLSCMWKAYVPILIVPYLGMIFYYNKKEKYDVKKNYKTLILLILIIVLLVTPNLVYNASNYKHNEVVDFLYATHFTFLKNDKIQQLYGWTLGGEVNNDKGFIHRLLIDGNPSSDLNNKPNLFIGLTESIYSNGRILSIAALLSLIYIYTRRKNEFCKEFLVFYLLYFIVPFIVLVNGNTLNKHYVHFLAFALPMISFTLVDIFSRTSEKFQKIQKLKSKKYFPYLLFVLALFYTFFVVLSSTSSLTGTFFSKNPEGILMQYKTDSISENSLIIYDDRIYNSEAGWLFNDRYYIPVSFLNDFLSYNQQSPNKNPTEVYIIECVLDDCGWGTISQNPSLNESMEAFFASLENQSIPVVLTIKSKMSKEVRYYNPLLSGKIESEGETFKVYKTVLPLDLSLAAQIKAQYEYFLYPTGYVNKESQIFKNFIYKPSGFFEILSNKVAWTVFYLGIILSFLSILFLLYEVYLRI